MRYRVTLDFSNPNNIVSATTGNMFYRKGDSFYLVDSKGIYSLAINKRLFVLNHPVYSRVRIPPNRMDVAFSKTQELWAKVGTGTNKSGWKFMGIKAPILPKPSIPNPGVNSGIVFVTYE